MGGGKKDAWDGSKMGGPEKGVLEWNLVRSCKNFNLQTAKRLVELGTDPWTPAPEDKAPSEWNGVSLGKKSPVALLFDDIEKKHGREDSVEGFILMCLKEFPDAGNAVIPDLAVTHLLTNATVRKLKSAGARFEFETRASENGKPAAVAGNPVVALTERCAKLVGTKATDFGAEHGAEVGEGLSERLGMLSEFAKDVFDEPVYSTSVDKPEPAFHFALKKLLAMGQPGMCEWLRQQARPQMKPGEGVDSKDIVRFLQGVAKGLLSGLKKAGTDLDLRDGDGNNTAHLMCQLELAGSELLGIAMGGMSDTGVPNYWGARCADLLDEMEQKKKNPMGTKLLSEVAAMDGTTLGGAESMRALLEADVLSKTTRRPGTVKKRTNL